MTTSRIIRPNFRLELPPVNYGLGGTYELEAFQCWEKADGRHIEIPGTRRKLAKFGNIITNLGLNQIGLLSPYGDYGHVGTGTAAESVADTSLDTFVASQILDPAYQTFWWAQATPPYYGGNKKKYRFLPGFGGGPINISEVGISTQVGTGGLFSRALVKDGGGAPTTVAVLGTEYFDMFYTLRNYPDHVDYVTGALDDGAGSFELGGVTYNYTIRCALITDYQSWGSGIFRGFNEYIGGFGLANDIKVYGTDAALGPVTGEPTATLSEDSSVGGYGAISTYTVSTYSNIMIYSFALDKGNLAGGIKGLLIKSSLGAYQMVLNAAIPKDNTKTMEYIHRTTWTRKILP